MNYNDVFFFCKYILYYSTPILNLIISYAKNNIVCTEKYVVGITLNNYF